MARIFALPVTLLALTMAVWAADQSADNNSEEPESFDVEPPILKQNLSDAPLRNSAMALSEEQMELARQNAAAAASLNKIGVLASVAVEQRLLTVVRCDSELPSALV